MAWVDAKYMGDRLRSTRELEAALLALSVLGNANDAIPRERVIQSYLMFIREHQELAGFVAWDLAAWHYWGAAPYTRDNQIECSATFRIARRNLQIFAAKPGRNKIDLDVSKLALRIDSAERSAIPMLPQ